MEQEVCCVCGQPLDENDVAMCDFCHGRFHMAMTLTSATKDCGIVGTDARFGEGTLFMCNT